MPSCGFSDCEWPNCQNEEVMIPPALPKPIVSTRELIVRHCDELKTLLLEKNAKYHDSAVNPVRIFSKASAEEQLLVRIDDKINRITQGEPGDEDVLLDLAGYLLLLRIVRGR
jgi:hypothetical protein